MYVKVGGYQHPLNEVNFRRVEIRSRFSQRNKRLTQINTLHIEGELQAVGQSNITSKIFQFLNAYRSDYQEIALYQDNGTRTPHGITNTNSISGVKILRRDWPMGDGAEYATKRFFRLVAYSEFADVETQLVHWRESTEVIGTGGPRFMVKEFFQGPVAFVTALRTAQRVIQSGEAIGFTAEVSPPGSYFPNFEHGDQRRIVRVSGENQGLLPCFYPVRWTYYHTLTTPVSGVRPTTR